MRMRSLGVVVVATGLAVAAVGARPGRAATFAGTNGGIAYSQFGKHGSQILVADPTSHKIKNVSKKQYGDDEPQFSPDGTKILFRNNHDIWTMTAAGGSRTDLTPGSHGAYGEPAWSPDGSQIVFADNGDIAVMKANGSNIHLITSNGDNQTPDWSPDGTQIAFVSTHDAGDIDHVFVMKPDGSQVKDLSAVTDASDQYYDQDPSWSADSADLLVDSDRPNPGHMGPIQIFEIARDGSSANLVSDSYGNAAGPVFSPAGTSFAFTTNDGDGTNQVYVEAFGSGSYTAVSDGPDTAIGDDASWQAVVHTTLKVSPTSAKAGARVTVTLAGYGDGDVVALTFVDNGVTTSLGTVQTDSHGGATTSVAVPAGAAAGTATISGTGTPSGRSASRTIKVKSG